MSTPSSRVNLWPAGILAAFALFIAGTAALVLLSLRHNLELVSADYYEQEIRYQGEMDKIERTRRLLPSAELKFSPGERAVLLRVPPAHARRLEAGSIHRYRPAAAALDRELRLELDSEGRQAISTEDWPAGLWKVRVRWTAGGVEYQLETRLVLETPGVAAPLAQF